MSPSVAGPIHPEARCQLSSSSPALPATGDLGITGSILNTFSNTSDAFSNWEALSTGPSFSISRRLEPATSLKSQLRYLLAV